MREVDWAAVAVVSGACGALFAAASRGNIARNAKVFVAIGFGVSIIVALAGGIRCKRSMWRAVPEVAIRKRTALPSTDRVDDLGQTRHICRCLPPGPQGTPRCGVRHPMFTARVRKLIFAGTQRVRRSFGNYRSPQPVTNAGRPRKWALQRLSATARHCQKVRALLRRVRPRSSPSRAAARKRARLPCTPIRRTPVAWPSSRTLASPCTCRHARTH